MVVNTVTFCVSDMLVLCRVLVGLWAGVFFCRLLLERVHLAVCGLRGVAGLRWWVDVSDQCEYLRWFPGLVPPFVRLPDYRVAL